ncbi:MAG: hypothetical protein JSU06_10290 [Actinobacteria bacterium]|nr:hypothetical protein [Actinomycetota bacterium]
MNRKLEPSDPRPMLALLAVAGAYGLWRLLSNLEPLAVLSAIRSVAPLGLGALAIATAPATHRLIATRRTLRSRRATAIVPADEFDADHQAVLRFAALLAATERRIGGWVDRGATAIRITLTGDPDGRLVYLLEAPERMTGALRAALEGFDGVELRPPEEVLADVEEEVEGDDRRPTVLRTELVPARPSVEPLARPELRPDPLRPFAAAIGSLGPGGKASVCVDLLPVSGWRAARLHRRLRRQARRIHGGRRGSDLSRILSGEGRSPGRPDPEEQLARRESSRALDAKLRDAGELFDAQILLRCEAPTRGRAQAGTKALLAAFRPLADRNHLRASGLSLFGLAFLGSDLPLRRGRFDRRLETGLFRPARRMSLTARELAGFLKPPTVHCGPRHVLRSGALLSPPPPLETFEEERADLIPLGRVGGEEGERIVGVPVSDTFFTYLAGRSRYGKTELAITQFAHLVRSGHGGFFLDPHGDGIERLEPYLAEADAEGRVVRIFLGPGSSPAELPGWNLFDLGGDGGAAERRVEAVVDAFASALEWGERSTRAINLTTQAAAALAVVARELGDPDLAPTIFQIPTLLGDEEWRQAVLPFLPNASRRFWTERFPLLSAEAITPITNMVDRLRASSAFATLLGRSRSTYSAREAMDGGKIVLAYTGAGGTRERLVANLLLFDALHTALGRGDLPPAKRRLFWLLLDEVQTYDGAASPILAGLLEVGAKFGVRAALLNQNPERLSPRTLNALLTNRSHLLASALNSHAAGLITREWGGEPSPEALTRMERFRFVAQVTFERRLSAPFALGGLRLEDALGKPASCEGRGHRRVAGGEEPENEVLAHLETLDDRIRARLEGKKGTGHTEGRKHSSRSRGPARAARRDRR